MQRLDNYNIKFCEHIRRNTIKWNYNCNHNQKIQLQIAGVSNAGFLHTDLPSLIPMILTISMRPSTDRGKFKPKIQLTLKTIKREFAEPKSKIHREFTVRAVPPDI